MSKKSNLQEETIKALMSEGKLNEAKDDEIVLVANGTVYWQGPKSDWENKEDELRVLVQDVASEDGVSIDTDEVDAYTVTEWENLNESKKVETVTPDKEFNGIKYFDNKDGWCPVCNTQLHYEPVEYAGDDVVLYPWHCTCGASGEAYFRQKFIGHSVFDEYFDLIDLPFDEPKTEGKLVEDGETYKIKFTDADVDLNKSRLADLEKKHNVVVDAKQADKIGNWEVTVTGNKDNIKAYMKDCMGVNYEEISDADFIKVTESKKVEAKLEDIQMEIYEMIQNARRLDNQEMKENIKNTVDAIKQDYPEIDEKELTDYVTKKADEIYAGEYDEPLDESKKVEAKLNFLPVSELPDICYGLLPSDNSIIVIKKGESGYYQTDLGSPENAEEVVDGLNEKMGVTKDQRFTMELRSINNNWSDKKTEAKETATDLEKAFTTEVKYWLQALVDEKSNDEIGKRAERILSDDNIVAEIVDELVNGSDELWEEIHLRIEQLAGINYRTSTRGKVESKEVKEETYYYNWRDDIDELDNTEENDELAYAFAENLMQTDKDYANYGDPWDVLSQIISIWKIEKRSRLYDYLLKWYGSEEEMKKHIRSFYETNNAIYFETGCGYSIFDADLLGGNANGDKQREFDNFVANGGKKDECKDSKE